MYKITPPSQQTQKGPKLRQSPVSQLQNNETVTEEVLQSSTEQYREQLEEMLDLKPSIRDFKSNNKNNKPDLWNTIQQIEKRMQEQEQNLQRVNSEQSEEINKLKSEIKQQKQQYEQEIEEIKYSSRIQSQKPQPSYNSYTPKNTRDYSYRSVSNNNLEDMQEKNYLQQLVQDLKYSKFFLIIYLITNCNRSQSYNKRITTLLFKTQIIFGNRSLDNQKNKKKLNCK